MATKLCFSLLSLLAVSPLTLASPVAPAAASRATPATSEPSEVAMRRKLKLGTAHGGALDLPKPTAAPDTAKVDAALEAQFMTITVVNMHGPDVSTIHVDNFGAPGPVAGNTRPGRLRNNQADSFVVPVGWGGNIAINDVAFSDTTGDESLIEASFTNQFGRAQGDVNISFVNGYSVPIVCWCNENNLTVGCNKNLMGLHSCPNYNGQGSCRNPHRGGPDWATDFFKPCFGKGGAYTFPNDSNANQLNGKCSGERYTCCVGTACRSGPV